MYIFWTFNLSFVINILTFFGFETFWATFFFKLGNFSPKLLLVSLFCCGRKLRLQNVFKMGVRPSNCNNVQKRLFQTTFPRT
jgi:hypothetical protein